MSLCGMPYQDADVWADIWEESLNKASESHICAECGGEIKKDSIYGFARALSGGYWNTWRRCQACLFLAEEIGMVMGKCALWGNLENFIENQAAAAGHSFPSSQEHRKKWDGG